MAKKKGLSNFGGKKAPPFKPGKTYRTGGLVGPHRDAHGKFKPKPK